MMQFQHQQQNHIYQNNQHPTDDFDESWVPNPHGQVNTSAASPSFIILIVIGRIIAPIMLDVMQEKLITGVKIAVVA